MENMENFTRPRGGASRARAPGASHVRGRGKSARSAGKITPRPRLDAAVSRFDLGHIDDMQAVAPMETPLTVRTPRTQQPRQRKSLKKAGPGAALAVEPLDEPLMCRKTPKKAGPVAALAVEPLAEPLMCSTSSFEGSPTTMGEAGVAAPRVAVEFMEYDGSWRSMAGSSDGNMAGSSDSNAAGCSALSPPRVSSKKQRVDSLEDTSPSEKRARFLASAGSEDEFEVEVDEEGFHLQVFLPRSLAIQYGSSDDEEEPAECFPHVNNPLDPSVTFEEGPAPLPSMAIKEGKGTNLISSPSSEPKEEGPTGMFNFVWEPLPKVPIPMEARRERFTGPDAGPTKPVLTPIDAFLEIWNDAIMKTIVEQTNKYAEQLIVLSIANELGEKGRILGWKSTNIAELYVFFALTLAMGILMKSDITEYWLTAHPIFRTPGFSEVMSRNRFQLLGRCLHFVDNESLDASNLSPQKAKLFKIAPIIAHLNERFQVLYNLGQNISLDESLTQWKGRLNIRQIIPNKAASVGIKSYEICESQTGYLYKFEVYAGRDDEPVDGEIIPGYIPNLVLRLVRGLEHRGHTLWMDNFYNSPTLARVLKVLGFDVVGTLRTNSKHVPKEIHDLKVGNIPMQQGQMFGCTSGDVDLMVWRDRRNVTTISTYHGLGCHYDDVECKRKPTLIRDYNVCMGGVDKKDQMLSAYPMERKRTLVWYKKLFRRLMNVSVLNAYIIYNKSNGAPKLTHREFRCQLVSSLLDRFKIKGRPAPPCPRPVINIMSPEYTKHFVVPTSCIPGTKTRVRRSCVYCKLKSSFECAACNVGLHVGECSQKYHQGQRKQ